MPADVLKIYLDFEAEKITSYLGNMKNKERIVRAPANAFH